MTQQEAGRGGHILRCTRKFVYLLKVVLTACYSFNINKYIVTFHTSLCSLDHVQKICLCRKFQFMKQDHGKRAKTAWQPVSGP